MRLTLITLALLLLILTACNDPLGYVQAEQIRANAQVQTAQIQADAQTEQARIDATTARVRIGGWMTATLIGGIVIVACVVVASMAYLQAQRDRLTADQWRASLPAQPSATALPTSRPRSKRPALMQRRIAPAPTLALPARSASHSDIVGIER